MCPHCVQSNSQRLASINSSIVSLYHGWLILSLLIFLDYFCQLSLVPAWGTSLFVCFLSFLGQHLLIKLYRIQLWLGGSVGWSIIPPKGCRFDPQSGHIPRLWVQSQGQSEYGRQLIDVSFTSIFLSFSLSLSLPSSLCLSLKPISISFG